MYQMSSRSVYFVAIWQRKTSNFPVSFELRLFVVSPNGSNLRKLNRVHSYKPFPIQRHKNIFCIQTPSWRNRAQKLTFKSVKNRQTNRQKLKV